MHETGKKIFDLMFRPGERVCVSVDKFGYHSIPLENAFKDPITLVSPNDKVPNKTVHSNDLILVALNPMKGGFRLDENCSAYRNFLVEMDCGSLTEQLAYIKKLGLPYSAAIFSGNKSLHFLISLTEDIPTEKLYRLFAEWTLNVVTLADQNTKNPSRSIRVPGALRDNGKYQELMEFHGPVTTKDLAEWLKKHPDEKPKEKQRTKVANKPMIDLVRPWVKKALVDGVMPPNRNKKWFTIAYEFALTGHEEEHTIELLNHYFTPERDFKEREWETTIRSAFESVYRKRMNG